MPPFVGRKRRSASPLPAPPPPAKKAKTAAATNPAKRSAPARQRKSKPFALGADSESSLSDVDSAEFEEVPPNKEPQPEDDDETSEDEDDFEDVPAQDTAPDFSNREFKDINITVQGQQDPDYPARASTKKGPSKREKEARMYTHKMHVQFLLWHNAKRNAWINDKEVHEILLKHLPPQIVHEVEKWRRASGLVKQEEQKPSLKDKKQKGKKWKANGERNERDWGRPSQVLEQGKPNMSSADPIISLLKVLAAFWKKKFAITAPGLRKRGYGTKLALRKEIDSYRNEKHHPAKHGEKIETLEQFRTLAEKCEGSRDLGAQLFTALLRAIGIDTRMVASLQAAGFGFTKAEEMVPRKIITHPQSSSSSDNGSDVLHARPISTVTSKRCTPASKRAAQLKKSQGRKSAPIDLDADTGEELSSDGDSVIDVTPSMPKARPAKYDKDLLFPVYWAEAISPITSKVYPVSPFQLENPVATSSELLSMFEPRGAKAEKARQVMAYVVAYSSDYSAKDVTIRYLRKRLWPGKTKGFRLPVDKAPIYDNRGKIKRYEEYDWFKHALSIYERSGEDRSAVDDLEDSNDLLPAESEKKVIEGDTLQSLRQSAEFVIEKHFRREEALAPGSKPVRTFTTGKGDKQERHPIYKRSDIRKVMTAESWHKEGRAPKEGETPMKLAPVRAVTLARKREAEAHLIRTGEKQMQGLYSEDQTDWIIPPPIKNGVIPKNAYGNIDCFVPSMVPEGAVHLPLKGTVRICKKLEVDYAEAVIGFEFGNKMAVPVIHGVVVAKENEKMIRDAWRIFNEEQKKREETKMERLVLDLWGKFYRGLIIRARVHEEYGFDVGSVQGNTGANRVEAINVDDDEEAASAGFMPEHDENEFGGGFLMDHEEDVLAGSELEMEAFNPSQDAHLEPMSHDADERGPGRGYPTPISAASAERAKAKTKKKHKKQVVNDTAETDLLDLSDKSVEEHHDHDEGTGEVLVDDSAEDDKAEELYVDKQVIVGRTDEDPNHANDKPTPQPVKRGRGRPRASLMKPTSVVPSKAAAKSSQTPTMTNSATPPSTRKTPFRNAKSKVHNLNLENAASDTSSHDSSSELTSNVSSDSDASIDKPQATKMKAKSSRSTPATQSETKSIPSTNGRRGRGRPGKGESTSEGLAIPAKAKRLLRTESTIVMSPYFA